MDLNSISQDILSLLSSGTSGVSSSTVTSSEYRLRATVSYACYNSFIVRNFPYENIHERVLLCCLVFENPLLITNVVEVNWAP